MEHPFWPSLLALYAEEIAPELERAQDVDVDSLVLCEECGAEFEDGACPYCQADWDAQASGACSRGLPR